MDEAQVLDVSRDAVATVIKMGGPIMLAGLVTGPEIDATVRRSDKIPEAETGGISAEASDNVRRAIWYKLWGNATINPLSALTRATAEALGAGILLFAIAGSGIAHHVPDTNPWARPRRVSIADSRGDPHGRHDEREPLRPRR